MSKTYMDKIDWGIIIGGVGSMFVFGVLFGAVFDKSDWIFLVMIIGFIIIGRKLNKIIKLLEKKK